MHINLYHQLLIAGEIKRREQQERFMDYVLERLSGKKQPPLLVQAPTGVGKTYGYLLPLIDRGQKAIISTGTKSLQDQLRRDLDRLSKYKKFSYLILKGKNNYLCRDAFKKFKSKKAGILSELIDKIDAKIKEGNWDGDFDKLDLEENDKEILQIIKQELGVDDDHCTKTYKKVCPYKDNCYYLKLKQLEKMAQVLVINHALLALRGPNFSDIDDTVLVIDEAHELDKYLVKSLTKSLSLYMLEEQILKGMYKVIENFALTFNKDRIKTARQKFRKFFTEFEKAVEEFVKTKFKKELKTGEEVPVDGQILKDLKNKYNDLVLQPLQKLYNELLGQVQGRVDGELPEIHKWSAPFQEYYSELFEELQNKGFHNRKDYIYYEDDDDDYEDYGKDKDLKPKEKELIEKLKPLETVKRKIEKVKEFYMTNTETIYGYSFEKNYNKRLAYYNYKINIFPLFPRLNYERYKAVIACSATLDPKDLEETTGLKGHFEIIEHVFSYKDSVKFYFVDINPSERFYEEEDRKAHVEKWLTVRNIVLKRLYKKYDKILVLETNKEHLERLERLPGLAIQNGNLSKDVEKLQKGEIKALAGVDSLWTGIDVKGDKALLMAKLPFEFPNDPLNYHRRKYFEENLGKNKAFEYTLRKALIKFKQGVGRLKRSESDKGVIVLCDNRIRNYRVFSNYIEKELGIKINCLSLDKLGISTNQQTSMNAPNL